MIVIKKLGIIDLPRIADIDRTEHVTLGYKVKNGKLISQKVDWNIPRWSTVHDGKSSVADFQRQWTVMLEQGAVLLGALDGDLLVGLIILRYKLTKTMAELAGLFVSKDYRRRGIAQQLTEEVVRLAIADGAKSLYVSSVPSESAVGFYTSQGFKLAKKVNKELFELEPEDIHMIKPLQYHKSKEI